MTTRTRRLSLTVVAAAMTILLPSTAFAAGIDRVNPTDLGVSWFFTALESGHGEFRKGPADPPLGTGSFEMDTYQNNVDKATLVTSDWTRRPLSELSALDYWTYRDPSSTSMSFVAPSINIAIFTNASGPDTGFATLVFEPLYSYGNDAIHDGEWQHWDTLAPSVTGFAGGWWTTRAVGSICAVACYTTLAGLQTQAPNATIISVGLNVGRGPASFIGAVDALSLTMAGATTTYDFEPLQVDKAGCKEGGWQDFHASGYRNQGDCVSFFASANRHGPKPETVIAKTERRADRRGPASLKAHVPPAIHHGKPAHDSNPSPKDKVRAKGH
jgi:hypothetical protein